MNLIQLVGISASLFTAISLIPQLVKMIREKQIVKMSLSMLGILFIGLSLWIWYGFLIDNWILIISNAFSLLVNLVIMLLSIKYKSP